MGNETSAWPRLVLARLHEASYFDLERKVIGTDHRLHLVRNLHDEGFVETYCRWRAAGTASERYRFETVIVVANGMQPPDGDVCDDCRRVMLVEHARTLYDLVNLLGLPSDGGLTSADVARTLRNLTELLADKLAAPVG